jgi:threonine/homoserine/homoserine lactone efflux protein
MDSTDALLAGLAAGFAIAMQVGAVSLLLIETAVASGPRVGAAAGMGVATVDLAFAAIAAAAGGAAGAALQSHEGEIRFVAAGVIAGIAAHGLVRLRREGTADTGAGPERPADGAGGAGPERPSGGAAGSHYLRFLAITAANPLTITSFAAVAVALSLEGAAAALAFTAGVGGASLGWHLFLGAAAGHAGRWITARVRRALAIGGRLAVLAIAVNLALGG